MDDSRSVLHVGALVPQAALPSPSIEPHGVNPSFSCRVCGGSDFTVETRPGVEVWLRSLRAHQQVAIGDFEGTHRIYTCIRCEATAQNARLAVREVLLAKLIFAARDLAEQQFTRWRAPGGRAELICSECRRPQVPDSRLRHSDACTVGRVMRLLQSLMSLESVGAVNEALHGFEAGMSSCGAGVSSSPSHAAARNRIGGAR